MSNTQYFLLAQLGIPEGQKFFLTKPVIKMGGDGSNDVMFSFADIDRFHIEIQWTGSGHMLVVLESGMNTRINGKIAPPRSSLILSSGDYIQLGQHIAFRYMVHHEVKIGNPPSVRPVQAPTQSQQNAVPPSYAIVKSEPIEVRMVTLTRPSRIGCKYCFYTLNPTDPDPQLQSFVKVGDNYYHATCYEKLEIQPPIASTKTTIGSIEPLEWMWLSPVVLDPGPTNTIIDKPIGISVGTVTIRDRTPQVFFIQNNDAQTMNIPRTSGVAWAYLHHENPYGGHEYTLAPSQSARIVVIPHFARPSFATSEIRLRENDVIDLSADTFSFSLLWNLILGAILTFSHFIILSSWGFSYSPWVGLFTTLISAVFVMAWLIYMIPGRLIGIGYAINIWLYKFGDSFGRPMYEYMRRVVLTQQIPNMLRSQVDYIGFSVVLALGVVLLAYLPVFLLLSFFPSVIRFLFALAYGGGLIWAVGKMLQDYRVYPLRDIWQFIQRVMAMSQAQKS